MYLVVAGGGGGGHAHSDNGGGGGAGGLRTNLPGVQDVLEEIQQRIQYLQLIIYSYNWCWWSCFVESNPLVLTDHNSVFIHHHNRQLVVVEVVVTRGALMEPLVEI